MTKPILSTVLATVLLASASFAQAQTTANPPPAPSGGVYVPSTHSPGCGGILCDGNDPRRIANVPPPPCQGLICSMTPYAMERPVTASEAARLQQAPPAVEAVPAPAPTKARKHRKAKAKSSKPNAVATRTPDPSTAPAPDAAR